MQVIAEDDIFRRWDHANYDLTQSKRYAGSSQALYHQAFQLRMTYQLADAMLAYFAVRQIRWPGEKAAITYWETLDPKMMELFFDCLRDGSPQERVARYEAVLAQVLLPAGGVWPSESVSANHPGSTLWESLLDSGR